MGELPIVSSESSKKKIWTANLGERINNVLRRSVKIGAFISDAALLRGVQHYRDTTCHVPANLRFMVLYPAIIASG
jgi:transposase-like protein